jgi:rSAM/selenodomain-associated transferase 1
VKSAIAVFAKAPAAGKVKTRLSPAVPEQVAAGIYEASLRDVVAMAEGFDSVQLAIFHEDDPESDRYFSDAFSGIMRRQQRGENLGDRLTAAFDEMFGTGVDRCVVIGADAPTLPPDRVSGALDQLGSSDAVVGPAADGGYYLIGVRRKAWLRARRMFESVPWSTERVLEVTLSRASEGGLGVAILPQWYDIDRPDDLRSARRDAAGRGRLGELLERLDLPFTR